MRAVVEDRCFDDPITMRYVLDACKIVGVAPNIVLDEIGRNPRDENNRRALSRFLAAMPILGQTVELRFQSHMQADRNRKPSDALDYLAIALVSPFVSYFVPDRSMYWLAKEANFNQQNGATALRSLADLRDRLKDELGD